MVRPVANSPASGQGLSAAQSGSLRSSMLQHERIRARLPGPDALLLDRLAAHAREGLLQAPPASDLRVAATRLTHRAIPGLDAAEAAALSDYLLGGIASPPSPAATRQMREAQVNLDLRYLRLQSQSQMQDEERTCAAVSNIMKTKHDTVKNSISNIR